MISEIRSLSKVRRKGLLVLLICGALSVWWGCALGWSMPGGPLDFQAVYYGSRTLLQHQDPYRVHDVENVFQAQGRALSELTPKQHNLITLFVNTPATLLLVSPLAMMPLAAAQVIWLLFVAGSLILGAFLMWDLVADTSPMLSTFLVGFVLLNCQVVFASGNTAGIVVGLSVVASWCFIRDRLILLGIVFMAVSLLIKPHDAGLVWLYFLLANSVQRKRALQTAALTVMFSLASVLWIWHVVPNWLQDWQSNLAMISGPGGMNDPRPAIVGGISAGNVISMQAVFSIFSDKARFYNLASYFFCGVPILLWAICTLRQEFSPKRAWFALAAIIPFTMLITYHRVYDAKLLLLTVPACAMLWALRGPSGKIALILTSIGIVLNADVPLAILNNITDKMHLTSANLSGKLFTVLVARPNQEVLLAIGLFYLWVYMQENLVVNACDDAYNSPPESTNVRTLNYYRAGSCAGSAKGSAATARNNTFPIRK